MAARCDPPEHRMVFRDGEGILGRAAPAGQDETRDPESERRLSDAPGPGDQPRMRQPARTPGGKEDRLRRFVAEQVRILARMHRCRSYPFQPATSSNRATTSARTASATRSSSGVESITTQRSGASAAIARNPSLTRR